MSLSEQTIITSQPNTASETNDRIVSTTFEIKPDETKTQPPQTQPASSPQGEGYLLETSEHGYLMATFNSSQKTHYIKVEIDLSQKQMLVNKLSIQSYAPVELTLMLKKVVTEMKKFNIAYVVQQVTKMDWIRILRPQRFFSFVNENKQHGFITVKCPIDRFPEAVIHGLGFSDITSKQTETLDHYESDNDNN